jgi:hypothetical protein
MGVTHRGSPKGSIRMRELKRILFKAYGGFADKRIKNLDKSSTFIADDRDDRDFGANRKLNSSFCKIFVNVNSNGKVEVTLDGNVPVGENVERWLKKHHYKIESPSYHGRRLSIDIERGEQNILGELAFAIQSIIAAGAPRYEVRSYKYVCPRTAGSLKRLEKILDRAWAKPLPPSPSGVRGFFDL